MNLFYLSLCIALAFCKLDIEAYTQADKEFSQKHKANIGNLDLLFLVDTLIYYYL